MFLKLEKVQMKQQTRNCNKLLDLHYLQSITTLAMHFFHSNSSVIASSISNFLKLQIFLYMYVLFVSSLGEAEKWIFATPSLKNSLLELKNKKLCINFVFISNIK